jgi:hypothetical protein
MYVECQRRAEETMSFKGIATIIIAGATLLCLGGTARAQDLEITVPFAFHVGGVTLPAGHYEVERDANTGIVLLRGDRKTPGGAFVFTLPADGRDPAGNKPALTFSRYEEGYRLSGIWESATDGRKVQ